MYATIGWYKCLLNSACFDEADTSPKVTSYYLPTVLINSVGLEEKLARLLAACNSVSYLLFATIGIPNVEVRFSILSRWSRGRMVLTSQSEMGSPQHVDVRRHRPGSIIFINHSAAPIQ